DALLDHGLIVGVQRNAGRLEDARAAEAARLGFEHVVLSVALAVDPLADRIAGEARLDLPGPGAPVGVDVPELVHVDHAHVGARGRDDDLHRLVADHHLRHAGGHATNLRLVVLPALPLLRQARVI